MKLISKINRYFLVSSLITLIIISGGLYFIIVNAFTGEIDEQLSHIARKAEQELASGKEVGFAPFIEVTPAAPADSTAGEYKNISIENKRESEPFRQYTSFVRVNGNEYKIITRISLIEKEDLLFSVLVIAIITIVFLVLVLFFINRTVSKIIFSDFYATIDKLDSFSLKNDDELELSKSDIKEFQQLNKSLLYLSKKSKKEYRSLKEFSEEVNHEIQTPIAVIKSKLELLLQSSNLNSENLVLLDTVLKNLSRLERINKSILLLNKIEQKGLFESTDIKLSEELNNVLNTYNEFISAKNITLTLKINNDISINANQSLIIILLSNLISNAIKYNLPDGKLDIEINGKMLTISNTGNKPKSDTDKYFARFYKDSDLSESVGLGLTIAKKICNMYSTCIIYSYTEGIHTITLEFKK